jgi:type IV pilus assembly protein PilV
MKPKFSAYFRSQSSARLNQQAGVALLEVLISILIFSIGIVALLGLQTVAVGTVSDSKIRVDATMIVHKLISEMRAVPRDTTTGQIDNAYLTANYASPAGPGFVAWRNNDVFNTTNPTAGLPGVSATVSPPTVVIDNNNNAVITVFWRTPKDPTLRKYVSRTTIY